MSVMNVKVIALGLLAAIVIAPNVNADPVIPAVISVSPSSGEIEGGETVTISGAAFVEENTVTIDGISVADTFVNANTLTFVTPPHNVGRVDIAVFAGISGAVLPNAYEYIDTPAPAPTPTPTPSVTSAPAPQAVPAAVVEAPVVQPTPTPTVEQTPTPEPIVQEPSIIVFSDNVSGIEDNGLIDVTVSNVTSPYKKYLLKRSENGIWKNTKVGYRIGTTIIFKDVVKRATKYIVVPFYRQEILIRKFRMNNE